MLGQHVRADFDDVVGPHTQDLRIEGSMVDSAHRNPVRHDGLTPVRVLLDVSSVEKRAVTEPAKSALRFVGEENTIPEWTLVEPLEHDPFGVSAGRVEWRELDQSLVPPTPHRFVQRHNKL